MPEYHTEPFGSADPQPTKNVRATRISRGILDGIGKDIVATRKGEIARDHISLEKGEYVGRDVLSLCLRANMVAEERDKMSDDEILGQIGTLVSASSSIATRTDSLRCSPETRPRQQPSAGRRSTSPNAQKFRPASAKNA